MMKIKVLVSTFFISILALSCSDKSPDDLLDITPAPIVASYLRDIKPIMEANCVSCHAAIPINGAPNSLVTYDNVKNSVLDANATDQLIYRISLPLGDSSLMPLSGSKLPQSKIDLIIQWRDQGFNQ